MSTTRTTAILAIDVGKFKPVPCVYPRQGGNRQRQAPLPGEAPMPHERGIRRPARYEVRW